MENLKQKSINGIIWNLIEKFGVQLIKLILGVILARLLTPEDFGLVGMVTVFFAIAMVFIDSGFGMAYIQKKEADDIDASTIFYFNLAVSTFFYVVMWFCAPLIANFYQQDQLVNLVRVLSTVLIINSIGLIQFSKLKREVDFKKMTLIILVSTFISGIIGIVAALLNYGVWSLVIQQIVASSIRNFGLWIFYKWKPLPYFKFSSLKSMFSFSVWALFIGIITSLFNNLYVLVIGKYFSAASLGFYSKAEQFRNFITLQTSDAVGAVAFPVLSKIQDDKLAFKNAVKKFNQHTIFFIAPLCAVFYVIAKPLFLILLTEKWVSMVPYFKIMLLAGILYPIHLINVIVLNAMAKMRLNFYLSMIKNALRVLNIILMYKYGIIYILYGDVILSLLSLALNTFYTKKFVNYGLIEQIKDMFSILSSSIILAVLGTLLSKELSNNYINIIVISLFIGSTYIITMYFLNKKVLLDNLEILKSRLPKRA
jgi:O-antigen/teichoic acid export membrane protein